MLALKIVGGLLAFFGLLGILAGYVFRISHWPGSTLCFSAGAALFVIGITALAVGFVKK